MRAILPGKPQAKLQAVTSGIWNDIQLIVYLTGHALVILKGPDDVLQTIYTEHEQTLQAVTIDEASGKIAVCAGPDIYVYQPYGQEDDALKWSLLRSLKLKEDHDVALTLSWGEDEELLVGSSSLTLFATHSSDEQLWSKAVSSPVKYAAFSPDAALIASTGQHDRLLKIWHRLGFGSAGSRFDYAYLQHPTTITGLRWRRPFHQEQNLENVLYTICADNKLRIWVAADPHGVQVLQLWGEINLLDSIQLRVPTDRPQRRYAFMIDSRDFMVATERAVQQTPADDKEQHALEHLISIAKRNPEVCVVLDDRGNMSAWSLENISHHPRKATDIVNIAHVEGISMHFAKVAESEEGNVQFVTFSSHQKQNAFTVLAHHFDGRLEWIQSRLEHLFDPTPRADRMQSKTILTGHSGTIKKVNRTETGRALVSRTIEDEVIVWTQRATKDSVSLNRHSTVRVTEHVHRTWLLQDGDFVVFLHHDSISLWDARTPIATEAKRISYTVRGKPLCLLLLPQPDSDPQVQYLATVSSEMQGIVWCISLPPTWAQQTSKRFSTILSPLERRPSKLSQSTNFSITLEQFCTFELGSDSDLTFMLPVDPAGTAPIASGILDTFAKHVAISYTDAGCVTSWTARVNVDDPGVTWLATGKIETAIERPALASGTSIRKTAVVDSNRTTLTIWNLKSAQLEHEETFEHAGGITDIDWSSTPDNQSILAVGFPHKVVVYAQLRYDYLDAGPSWASVREVRTHELTPHPVGDSVWLSDGHLVICAGNQLFVQDDRVEVSESFFPEIRQVSRRHGEVDLFTLVGRLNGPLPVYHPQFLAQCVLAGKLDLVQRILVKLHAELKFFTDGDALDWFLNILFEDLMQDDEVNVSFAKKEMHSSYADFSDDDQPSTVTEDVSTQLKESLTKWQLPLLSSREQFHLADVVECVAMLEKHRRSIDLNGSRFIVFFRQHVLRCNQSGSEQTPISWREIIWAYFSGSQDILIDLVSRHFQGRMLWTHAKQSGLFMWMSDLNTLRAQFEVVARNEYTKTDERNPVDCSLHYLALRKKAVLVGLWRMATWSREQGATQRLLSNNFAESRWKTAALKNAYALMGRHRFEYAAAFFLLADHLTDAVRVLSNQLGDWQLAIAVARVYEGDDGPVLKEFLTEQVLPHAVREGNRWLATWVFWMLAKRDNAVRALVSPLSSLVSPPETPNPQSKLFLTDDPALVVLYQQLRGKSLQTLRGAIMIPQKAEWDFIMHTARLYERMGCDVLALDLVRSWEFLKPPPPRPLSPVQTRASFVDGQPPSSLLESYDFDPKKLLRRRSSQVVADLPVREGAKSSIQNGVSEQSGESSDAENAEKAKKAEPKKKPPPTLFKEPDANSLLDSFGF